LERIAMNTSARSTGQGHDHQPEHSHNAHGSHGSHCEHAAAEVTTVKDPVCGMSVTLGAGKPSFEHDEKPGTSARRSATTSLPRSRALPDRRAQEEAEQAPPAPAGTQYTCPMHPEIVRDAPGDCPKCGMALEPMGVPTGDEGPNPELVDFRRRFSIGAVLTVPLLVLTMGPFVGLGFVRDLLGERTALWVELVF
jgi:Cu+-exporting ATPase